MSLIRGRTAFASNMFTDYPVMLEDDSVIADESGAFAKATSIDPEIGPAHILAPTPWKIKERRLRGSPHGAQASH